MTRALPLLLALTLATHAETSTHAPGLQTPLERELWHALVLLEGDVETATSALDSCETALHDLEAAPEPSPAPATTPALDWLVPVAAVAIAFASGIAFGFLLDDGDPQP